LQTQRRHEAAADKEIDISFIQQERRFPSVSGSDTQAKACLSTHWGWSSQAFLRQKMSKSSQKLAQKEKRAAKQGGTR